MIKDFDGIIVCDVEFEGISFFSTSCSFNDHRRMRQSAILCVGVLSFDRVRLRREIGERHTECGPVKQPVTGQIKWIKNKLVLSNAKIKKNPGQE